MFFFSRRRRHTSLTCDWSSDVCSSDLVSLTAAAKDTASQAVKDAYAGLKALVKKRFEKRPHAEVALAEYENDPDTWRSEERRVGKEGKTRESLLFIIVSYEEMLELYIS